jgi:hypothetical protein
MKKREAAGEGGQPRQLSPDGALKGMLLSIAN